MKKRYDDKAIKLFKNLGENVQEIRQSKNNYSNIIKKKSNY